MDTIALRDSMGILGPVFADPNICKVICRFVAQYFVG